MYELKINFEQKGLTPVVLNEVKAGESLLEVILDAGIELHHNCGAVCAWLRALMVMSCAA